MSKRAPEAGRRRRYAVFKRGTGQRALMSKIDKNVRPGQGSF